MTSKISKSGEEIQYFSKNRNKWIHGKTGIDDLRREQMVDQMTDYYSPKQDILFYHRELRSRQNGDLIGILSWSASRKYFIYSELDKGHPVQYYRVSKSGKLTQKVSDEEQSYILYG